MIFQTIPFLKESKSKWQRISDIWTREQKCVRKQKRAIFITLVLIPHLLLLHLFREFATYFHLLQPLFMILTFWKIEDRDFPKMTPNSFIFMRSFTVFAFFRKIFYPCLL